MTKKSKTSKQNDKDYRPFRFQSLHERLNNININVVHRIRYHDNITDLQDNHESHFHQSLEHWSTLNFSEAYSKLHNTLISLAGSLEQVVYNREQIISLLRQSLNEHDPLIIETLLDLIVQLARDLQSDFYIYYKEYLFVDIINLLLNSKKQHQQQNEMNTQLLEQVFQCLTYLFKYLWRIMLKDLANLYELYSKYFFSSSSLTTNSEYIRSFAAESFAYLLRKIENYQSFLDYLFNRKELNQDELDSLALVFTETCKNVQSTFHSCTKSLLICLLKKFLEKPNIIQSCIKTIYHLLIEHTTKQYVQILWNCFMDIYRTINHNEQINYLIYQTFYEIFQLFIEHKMIIDWEFLKIVQKNENPEF
jgi:U3 small nucleolar RNA-associated protein 20